jgi:hypothetical protein
LPDFYYLNSLLKRPAFRENDIQIELNDLKDKAKIFYKDYSPDTDRKVVKSMIRIYASEIPIENRPDFYRIINKKYKGNSDKYVDKLFDKSIFADEKKLMKFIENPNGAVLSEDMAFKTGESVLSKFFEIYNQYNQYKIQLEDLKRLYVQGCMEMDPGRFLYPDANFTMRLTYGTVRDYDPSDAIHYDFLTTMKGIMEKEDSTNFEFIVPEDLKKLYLNSDFGNYDENNIMPVCFITDNDITGGNSGSPVFNAKGELAGIAFDGNWESMSGEMEYNPNKQRCICVDIRYVLFIIDKFAGDENIIKELNIVH